MPISNSVESALPRRREIRPHPVSSRHRIELGDTRDRPEIAAPPEAPHRAGRPRWCGITAFAVIRRFESRFVGRQRPTQKTLMSLPSSLKKFDIPPHVAASLIVAKHLLDTEHPEPSRRRKLKPPLRRCRR